MAEDGELSTKLVQKTQETFQRAQEVPSEHRFPARTGIVNVPRGSRGPRSLYIARRDDSFGFTLRHFIVYPPEPTESDARHPSVEVQLQPMETIFVRNVAEGGPAELAGLKCGDRLVAVNGKSVTDKSYSQVIQLIQRSPEYLHLLVISKDEDVLQKFYTNIAYNPASNQSSTKERHGDRKRLVHQEAINPRRCSEFQADAISWRSLQNPSYSSLEYGQLKPKHPKQEQRSADNILTTPRDVLRNQPKSFEIYTKPVLHESYQRPRAQPQVPMHRKMGRRASEGSTFAERDIYQNYHLTGQANEMVVGENMKTSKNPYMSEQASHPSLEMPVLSYPTSAGCRLSLDAGRRDSSSSLTSSLADGSKDSLNSYDSSSTMTGYDLDNPDISKIIKRFQQKEEFLKSGKVPENSLIQREFYSRPKKLEKQVWPPFEPRQESPSRTNKPTHQNFQRVKNDIEIERDYIQSNEPKQMPMQKIASAPRDWSLVNNHHKPREASPPPNLQIQQMNGSAITADFEEKRNCPPQGLQIVSRRARQFETGRPLPEDDPLLNDRTSFYRSELARLSAKRVVPNVTVRAREFETRSSEPRRDTSTSSANSASTSVRKTHRDSRSLDSSGSNASVSSLCENVNTKLTGNYTVPVGSKYIHVPVPKDYQPDKDVSNIDNLPNRIRVRSNSADSWVASSQGTKPEDNESLGHGMNVTTKRDRSLQEAMDTFPVSQNSGDLSPLIPEPVAQMQLTPSVSITPAPTHPQKSAIRPTQLDLNAPKRPARHLRPPSDLVETPPPRSGSPVIENRPVVMRRTKNTNIADEERAMRRESYLKATEGGRMHFDSDQSDGDVSPQVLRSSSVSGGSSSSVSLEREKRPGSPTDKEKYNIIKEGHLHCKVTEIDGKRSADRSWKQIWVVLKGPKLYLYKDRHHQSPVGTSDVVEQSLASGVDMRASCVRVAEDYTKRKHVLRVSSVKPCRSELLLQADNTVDLADWVRALQEQVAASTDVEGKLEQALSTQQAVPQTIPASTSIQVQGSSRLSPQPHKSKLPNLRNRSPTGQSPVSKTRKPPSQSHEASATSPKSKTWRGRVVKQFRKIQGASSPSSPTAPEGYTFGIPLEQCIPSNNNQFVPKLVEECTKIVENKGLEVVGIYRVPGNNAAVTALTDEVNRNEELSFTDQRWNDVHVVSSLLKSFFRKMPDSLLTTALYPSFIEADKIDNAVARMNKIKELVKNLPPHHYNTLKHLILHLRKVVEHSEGNRMEARNLAIVFGPTIVRAGEESMEMMVNDMTHQCKIVESLVSHADWFFDESNVVELNLCAPIASTEVVSANDAEQLNTAVLLDNIGKIEGFRDKEQKEKKEFIQSLFSAAQRKVKRKTAKSLSNSQDSKEEVVTSNSLKDATGQSYDMIDSKENVIEHKNSNVPTTVTELDKSTRPWYNYKTDREKIDQRIKNFIQETEANMKIPRKSVLSSNHSLERKHPGVISSSASNVNQNAQMSLTTHSVDPRMITKTHSASNVFSRTTNSDNTGRNSLSSADNYKVQYSSNFNNKYNVYGDYANSEQNRQLDNISDFHVYKSSYSDLSTSSDSRNYKPAGYGLRKGNSAENINSSSLDLNGNTSMKKIKYDESDLSQRTGSLDSLHKVDEDDLLKTMTKIFDEKLPLRFELDSIPYADESPEKLIRENLHLNKEHNIPSSPKLYRNPSLHKSQYTQAKLSIPTQLNKESKLKEYNDKVDKEKDEDSTMVHDENMPDNERHILNQNKLAINRSNGNVKLKRSESLNKPERTVSPLNVKLKRSESLNKASNDKLKRSDSLTKTEKTESNISKRRELSSSSRRANKEFIVKLKRKNGMPERSIKRRHTVGGTKDPDKVTWLDNCYQEEDMSVKESIKEKNSLRTSSPDLSSTRRERLLLQVNLIAPQDMVAALRHHLIGARPQSFPEAAVYKVPLESHV